jgi:hypothetical protein
VDRSSRDRRLPGGIAGSPTKNAPSNNPVHGLTCAIFLGAGYVTVPALEVLDESKSKI